MIKIIIHDCDTDLRKIDLTNFLRVEKKLSLKPAKKIVDDFLDGTPFELQVYKKCKLSDLLVALDDFGLIYSIDETGKL